MGLMLDDLGSGTGSERDHVAGNIEVASVVNADLGNDKRGFSGADFAVCDLHGLTSTSVPAGRKPFSVALERFRLTKCLRPGSEPVSVQPMNSDASKGSPGWRYRLFLAGYGALIWLGRPWIWRYFRRRAEGDPDYGLHMEERRGEGANFDADIWVHAVSLGEMKSAEPLISLVLAEGYRVLTTHATPAGRRAAEGVFSEAIGSGQMAVRYAPVDTARYWREFFAKYQPRAGLVMEMEFWPAMLETAKRAGCPLFLANSQVPGKSLPRARRLARWFGHPVTRATGILAKSEPMAARFRELGAENVQVVGETRFDIAPPTAQVTSGISLGEGRTVLTLASVVKGEEDIYTRLLGELLAEDDAPLVIWVPRAPELFEVHAELLQSKGFEVARRSEAFDADLAPLVDLGEVQILIGNSLGEMFFYLSPADAVIVGGGFTVKGAHNVIEPLSLGKPVITGPDVWTIEFPGVEAEAAGVLTVVRRPDDLARTVRTAIAEGGPAAKAFHGANQGASARIFDAIRPMLEARG